MLRIQWSTLTVQFHDRAILIVKPAGQACWQANRYTYAYALMAKNRCTVIGTL